MNIAFVINELIRPSEVFILNQITGLIDRGHSIDIYAYPMEDYGEPVHEDILRYRLDRRFFPHPEVSSNKWICRFQAGWATLLRLAHRPGHDDSNPSPLPEPPRGLCVSRVSDCPVIDPAIV